MCQAICFHKDQFSREVLKKAKLGVINDQVKVYFTHQYAVLPVLYWGNPRLIRWGNKRHPQLPRSYFCKMESYDAGKWNWLQPLPLTILASAALVNGIWFQIRQGIQGLVVQDQAGFQYCYILTQVSTHYFKTMTGAGRMPVLINQIL